MLLLLEPTYLGPSCFPRGRFLVVVTTPYPHPHSPPPSSALTYIPGGERGRGRARKWPDSPAKIEFKYLNILSPLNEDTNGYTKRDC